MDFSNLKSLTIPEGEVAEITCGGVVLWKSGYTNLVPLSTEADGKTIYNGGKGYKDGYRIRSGGAESAHTNTACTGYIPFKKGEALYIYPAFKGHNVTNAINFSGADYNNLGQINDSGTAYGICSANSAAFRATGIGNVSVLDLSNNDCDGVEDIAFVRITNDIVAEIASGSQMIITKNEEIEL